MHFEMGGGGRLINSGRPMPPPRWLPEIILPIEGLNIYTFFHNNY